MIYRTAQVVNVEDEETRGRVQVRILPELNGVDDAQLPWAEPYSQGTGASADTGVHNPPELDSYIRVLIEDKFWKRIKYVSDEYVKGFYPYSKFAEETEFDSEDYEVPEYPQPHFRRSKSGLFFFEDTETGDVGLHHPSGTYVVMTADGKVSVKYGATVKVYNDSLSFEMLDDGTIKATADTFQIDGNLQVGEGADNVSLFAPLEKVLEQLLTHVHVAPSGPTGPALDSSQAPMTKYKMDVKEIKSEVSSTD